MIKNNSTTSKRWTEPILHFRITERMVEKFANLTGDYNLLHADRDFARRSRFRQKIVHGMLPFAFTFFLGTRKAPNQIAMPTKLIGQFIEPVYIGDELILCGRIAECEDGQLVRWDYTITKAVSGTIAIKGSTCIRYISKEKKTNGEQQNLPEGSSAGCLLTHPLDMQELLLEEINKNDTDGFTFQVTKNTVSILQEILAEGLSAGGSHSLTGERDAYYLPNLLSLLLFSTSVGICIPGKYATFLGFEANFTAPAEMGTLLQLAGEISHISRSTRLLNKSITIQDPLAGKDLADGKINILVNPPPPVMPTVAELSKSARDFGLKGKVVIITGSSRGIGETTAKLFSLYGAKVIVNYYRGKKDATRIVSEITEGNGTACAVQADVTDHRQVREMVQQALAEFGRVDILVNNAVNDFKSIPFSRLTWEDIQKDIDVVIKGTFNCCKEAIPEMIKQGGGKIINIGTVATDNPPTNQTKYIISKSGLVGLTRSLSIEYAPKNIQINLVVPNFVDTDLVAHIPEVYKKKIAKDTPLQRNATPVDVANAIIYLASSFSSFTTGQKIMVTGGGVPYT